MPIYSIVIDFHNDLNGNSMYLFLNCMNTDHVDQNYRICETGNNYV